MYSRTIKQDVLVEKRAMVRFREIKKGDIVLFQNILKIAETKQQGVAGVVENGDRAEISCTVTGNGNLKEVFGTQFNNLNTHIHIIPTFHLDISPKEIKNAITKAYVCMLIAKLHTHTRTENNPKVHQLDN